MVQKQHKSRVVDTGSWSLALPKLYTYTRTYITLLAALEHGAHCQKVHAFDTIHILLYQSGESESFAEASHSQKKNNHPVIH